MGTLPQQYVVFANLLIILLTMMNFECESLDCLSIKGKVHQTYLAVLSTISCVLILGSHCSLQNLHLLVCQSSSFINCLNPHSQFCGQFKITVRKMHGDPDSDVLTVTRAVLNDPQSLLLKLVEAEGTREEIDEAIALVQNGKCDYSGIYFKNYFRVNHPIKLVDLGFYGPYEESTADYDVQVQLYKPRKPTAVFPDSNGFRIASKRSQVVNARNRELFHVGFLEPVYIQPHIWHLIEFRLDGPPTLRSNDTLDSAKVQVPNERSVDFQFRLGSKQMPCLRFKLA